MKSKTALSIVALILAITLFVAACTPAATPVPTSPPPAADEPAPEEPAPAPTDESALEEAAATTDERGMFRYSAYWEPQHGNPILVGGEHYLEYMFDALYRMDADGSLVPRLAERWDISPDGLEYTFYLRQDVKWHDGEPFTAGDVVFTVNAIQDQGPVDRRCR